jgi:hypothetical protein
MAQKSNLLTLRKKNFIQVVTHNTKTWVSFFLFIENLNHLFFLKGVSVCNYFLGVENNSVFLELFLFFHISKKVYFEKKKQQKQNLNFLVAKNHNNFLKFFKTLSKYFHLNVFTLKTKLLNNSVKAKYFRYFYSKTKFFISTLFVRRYKLYIDFLQFTCLFLCSKINIKIYTNLLGRIFQYLSKRLHGKFLSFLKIILSSLVDACLKKDKKGNFLFLLPNNFLGSKLLLNGKFRGKTRSSSKLLQIGQTSLQSISKDVEYSSCHINTLYGVFGLKIWVYKKNR